MSWRYPVLEAHSPIISDGGGYSDPAWFHWRSHVAGDFITATGSIGLGRWGAHSFAVPHKATLVVVLYEVCLSVCGQPVWPVGAMGAPTQDVPKVDIRVGDDTILRKSASPSVTHLDSPGAGRVSRDEFLYSTQVFTRMTNFSRGHHQTGVGNALKKHYSKRFPSHSLMCRTRIESHAYIHHLAHSSAPIRSKPRSRLSASHVA
eukprot:7719627-Pyramimonas_sp.AAC.2